MTAVGGPAAEAGLERPSAARGRQLLADPPAPAAREDRRLHDLEGAETPTAGGRLCNWAAGPVAN